MIHYDLNWIQRQYNNKENIDYLFFWGHTNKTNEQVGKFILSQRYPSPFVVEDITYSTSEQWMMAGKARLFNDVEILEKIIGTKTPKEAKELEDK